ncbi:MAG: flagellar motor protein MotB [Hyphomicrobiaceae bacterium]
MSDKEATAPREIVIIRRKGGDDEGGHKGGAWKIAFADFMTALMAFFLVMWLINSSDKKTITQVATYFNPLKLSDKTTSQRGVNDMSLDEVEAKEDAKTPQGKGTTDKKPENKQPQKQHPTEASGGRASPDSSDKARRFSDEELFSDPYGVLAKLALQAVNPSARLGPGAMKENDEKEGRGDAWRDPFDPSTWRPTRRQRGQGAEPQPAPQTVEAQPLDPKSKGATPATPASGEPAPKGAAQQSAEAAAKAEADAQALAAQVAEALRNSLPANQRPDLTVVATPEGLLISLTDKSDFGMFAIGSAEPRAELVVLMESVAKALASRPGAIVVRGHTDGRPFRGGSSDNWRLSTSRAHMTQYMLVRGGIPERRIERIEGYADQKLRTPDDPGAAQNRRIEILLRVAT